MEAIPGQLKHLRERMSICGRIGIAALVVFGGIETGLAQKAGNANAGPLGIATREAARREDQLRKAQLLLQEGEQLRASEDYSGAIEKYRSALVLLPAAPATREMREAVFSRYQSAAIQLAKQQIAEARYADAETTLTNVITDARDFGFPPGVVSEELKTLLKRVKSDDYFNKALSPEHLTKTRAVEQELKLAKGHFDIGNYDGATESYNRVLNLDPYNEAARRGLENTEQKKIGYSNVARDSTRATFLSEIAAGWESPTPPTMSNVDVLGDVGPVLTSSDGVIKIREKLSEIIIPSVEFADTPLGAVVDFLVQRSIELDAAEPDPVKKGVNIVFDPSGGENVRSLPVTLRLNNVPLGIVLRYALENHDLEFRVDDFAITIGQLGSSDDTAIITRRFVVPPDFLRSSAGAGGNAGDADPFADPFASNPQQVGAIVERQTAEEYLKERGVQFPEGSSAVFVPDTSTLVIRNTRSNIEMIETLVIAAREAGTKLVRIEMTSLTISEEGLRELGFDSLLGGANVPGSDRVFFSGGTTGNQDARGNGDFPVSFPGGQPVGGNPLTAGLRSGDPDSSFSIDDVISRDSPSNTSSTVSPAIFGLAGVFSDPQFQLAIRALNQHKSTDVLSKASIVTLPGQRAVIRQVREFMYPTEYDPPEIPQGGGGNDDDDDEEDEGGSSLFAATPATPTAFERRDLGNVLEVEPLVGGDNVTIDLNIITDMSEFSGFINYGTPISNDFGVVTENEILMPVFESIKNTTNVSAYDGATVALGGLISEGVTSVEDRVPFLGDLPGVGRLFRTEQDGNSRTALLLFVTVNLLDPSGRPLNELAEN